MVSKVCDNWHLEEDRYLNLLQGLEVLVVDDNDDSLELVRIILEEYGTQVVTAASAREALNVITQSADYALCASPCPEASLFSCPQGCTQQRWTTSRFAATAPCYANANAIAPFKPDILISDIAMPSEDGYWLIRQIRTLSPKQGGLMPAIALTACVIEEERTRSLAAGFQIHLPKPIEPDELVAVVAHLAEQKFCLRLCN